MDIKGSYNFHAPASRVWKVLLDPDILASCIPGCEKLDSLGDDRYEATMSVGVGSIKGRYQTRITVSDQEPIVSYKLIVEGNGAPGFIRGEAVITLEEEGEVTLVKVDGEAQVGGTIARVGQRLLGGVNRMMMDKFFTCLQKAAA